jgi:peptidyl-tRNA hydrolase ICT1
MLRCRLLTVRPPVPITSYAPAVRRTVSSARDSSTDEDLRAARSWLAGLDAEAIPLKSIGELSFSRSSGPGGQNVNKYDKLAKTNGALY